MFHWRIEFRWKWVRSRFNPINGPQLLKYELLRSAELSVINSVDLLSLYENVQIHRDCGMAKSSEPIKWQDSNTPTLTPYKAFSGALLL